MAITEHELKEAMAGLRREFTEQLNSQREQFAVQVVEAANARPGLSIEKVREEIERIPAPNPGLSLSDVEEMLKNHSGYNDEGLRGQCLQLRVFANELADRLGAPRMEEG